MINKMNVIRLAIVAQVFLSGGSYAARLSQNQVNALKPSVVRVGCMHNTASGFIYGSTSFVVTAYHVIAGSTGNVTIYYPSLGLDRPGTVIKTLKSADLALIQISNPITVPVLARSTAVANYNEDYTALGFLWDATDYFTKDITKKDTRDLNFLPQGSILDLQASQCPDIKMNVYTFSGDPLVPGYSGAPIFDSNGNVLAIGDGGVKQGLGSASWGIPCSKLNDLMASPQTSLGTVVLTHTLYSADNISEQNWQTDILTINGEDFHKVRTEQLASLIYYADDPNGLNLILGTFPSQLDKQHAAFDVYQDFSTGAIFILPVGYTPTINGHEIVLLSSNGQIEFSLSVEHCNFTSMLPLTAQLELSEKTPVQGWSWTSVPAFTYVIPVQRWDGFTVRRAAFAQQTFNNNMLLYNNYLFESFVFKKDLLMYLKVKNANYTTSYVQNSFACMNNGYSAPGCGVLLNEADEWMKMCVAVHFANFSL